jgi:hypothetical protein
VAIQMAATPRCVRRALIFDFALRTDLKFGCF